MRIYTTSLATETNTFSPIPTARADFIDATPSRCGPERPALTAAHAWVLHRRAAAEGLTVIEGPHHWAEPAGLIARAAYESLRDDLLNALRAALPVDAVVLGLHGAMAAHGYDDCEGDILRRARALVGPDVPIAAELDPHCHLTQVMAESADLLICYKEFPHTDSVERAEELVALTLRTARREIRPRLSLHDCRTIASFPTSRQPMRGFVDGIKRLENQGGVLSISVVHSFPYADMPELGAKILVITDDRQDEGDRLARDLGRRLIAIRAQTQPPHLTPDEAIDRALASTDPRPVVVADPADNPGGGAPADSTVILRRLVERGIENAALAPLFDPMAVRLCFAAGEGARLPLRIGGKTSPASGHPLDAEVEITKLVRDATQTVVGGTGSIGDAAAVRIGGVSVVLTSYRNQAWGTDLFSNLGIDPLRQKLLVVKSTNHFFAAFAPIAAEVLYADSGGALPRDYRQIPYQRVRRPIWPLDEGAGLDGE
jgi:microcystin degradation protein MlrC